MLTKQQKDSLITLGLDIRKFIANEARHLYTECKWDVDLTDMAGACGFASYIFNAIIPNVHCVVGTYKNNPHAWNVLGVNIIDLTATQFDIKDPVHITYIDDNSYQFKDLIKDLALKDLGTWEYNPGWTKELKNLVNQQNFAKIAKLSLNI